MCQDFESKCMKVGRGNCLKFGQCVKLIQKDATKGGSVF